MPETTIEQIKQAEAPRSQVSPAVRDRRQSLSCSYKHMFKLVQRYGEITWTAALLPVSVDGMIVASSMSLLADYRQSCRSGPLPWTLLVIGSAANVAVAEPSVVGRLIAAWPSCALIGSYQLLMRQVRQGSQHESAVMGESTYEVAANGWMLLTPLMRILYKAGRGGRFIQDSYLPRRVVDRLLSCADEGC